MSGFTTPPPGQRLISSFFTSRSRSAVAAHGPEAAKEAPPSSHSGDSSDRVPESTHSSSSTHPDMSFSGGFDHFGDAAGDGIDYMCDERLELRLDESHDVLDGDALEDVPRTCHDEDGLIDGNSDGGEGKSNGSDSEEDEEAAGEAVAPRATSASCVAFPRPQPQQQPPASLPPPSSSLPPPPLQTPSSSRAMERYISSGKRSPDAVGTDRDGMAGQCPVCGQPIGHLDNIALNAHLDRCLDGEGRANGLEPAAAAAGGKNAPRKRRRPNCKKSSPIEGALVRFLRPRPGSAGTSATTSGDAEVSHQVIPSRLYTVAETGGMRQLQLEDTIHQAQQSSRTTPTPWWMAEALQTRHGPAYTLDYFLVPSVPPPK